MSNLEYSIDKKNPKYSILLLILILFSVIWYFWNQYFFFKKYWNALLW